MLCRAPDGCEEERQWLASVQPGLIVVADEVRSLDTFVMTDGASSFAEAVQSADYAVADRKWRSAIGHLDRAAAALGAWPGTVENHLLVRMYLLRGVALRNLGRDGAEVALRQAAASAWKSEPDPRGIEAADQLALDTERRKLLGGGGGTLLVEGNATLWVDGIPVERRSLELPAGLHRVTAVEPGRLRTFVASVPVLPGRSVTIRPEWGPTDDTAWLLSELARGVEELDADPLALLALSDWCVRHEAPALTLVEVVPALAIDLPPSFAVSAPDPGRPDASAGAPISQEAGIPATFEAATAEAAEAAGEPGRPLNTYRLRSAYFDPVTRRLSAEPAPIVMADTVDNRRFRLSARLGWRHQLEREHATIDARAHYRLHLGSYVVGELGVVVADSDYNLYADWTGTTLLHAALGYRWQGEKTLSPFIGAALEVQAPLWVGAYTEMGLGLRFDRDWVGEIAVNQHPGFAGGELEFAYGLSLSLGRRW